MSDKITAQSVPAPNLPDTFVETIMLVKAVHVTGGTLKVSGSQPMVLIRLTMLSGAVVILPLPVDGAMMLSAELTQMAASVEAMTNPQEKGKMS